MSNQISVIEDLRNTLTRMEPQLKAALPAHITPQKFTRVAMTAIQLNPKILDCDRRSLFAELIKCAQDGLICDGSEAAIIPYGKMAKYQPMVKGICKKARNSGEIATMDAVVVYENDHYESWVDEKGPHFKHVKAKTNRGVPILTYAYAITKDGAFYHEEIDEDQMAAIEKTSRGDNTPWKGPFRDEMKRKSALKRLAKYRLPSSADLDAVIDRDNDLYDVPSSQTHTAQPHPPQAEPPVEQDATTPKTLTKLVAKKKLKNHAEDIPMPSEEPPVINSDEELPI